MTQTALEISSGSPYAILVTFQWGDSSIARYCRWTEDLTIGGNTFTNEPSLKIFADQPFQGGTDDNPIDVQIRMSLPPFNKLVLPYKHSKVSVLIEEVAPDDEATLQELFTGQLGQLRVRPDGKAMVARATIAGPKRRLKSKAGLQCLSECLWQFGKIPCHFPLEANTVEVEIIEVGTNGASNRITADFASGVDLQNDRWKRGKVVFDGLAITIRQSFGDGRFDLHHIPPPDWINQDVNFVPGCAKTIEICRLHGQEENFMGMGIAMPDRNPVVSAD